MQSPTDQFVTSGAMARVMANAMPQTMHSMISPGLQSLYDHCLRVYPTQSNPLQVTAVLKYWLGGPDPLDYISMYSNPGDADQDIPPHWHYISFGLSDLHGDGRVHEITDLQTPSGFGFELTFRLKREPEEMSPPTWPAAVMQALAKYVFQSSNLLCAGDHVSWHCPLDNSESRIQHMLMSEDPQLGQVMTCFGSVTFIQIVGVCLEELKAAQKWNGPGVIDLLRSHPRAGGHWLVTDMRRGETIFELDPQLKEAVDDGIATQGSNLSGVSARCSWTQQSVSTNNNEESNDDSDAKDIDNNKVTIGENENNDCFVREDKYSQSRNSCSSAMSVSHDQQNQSNSRMSFASETGAPEPGELIQTKYLKRLNLKFNLEAGLLLPLALRGRLKHDRHFTFKSIIGDLAITFVTPAVSGSFVSITQPYAIHGPWLQVLIPNDYIDRMLADLNQLDDYQNDNQDNLPKKYDWPEKGLSIELMPEDN
ncbi:suppressor of fused homolog [Oppia nitens]|uniref:suppressor of fused homolog n=1 Tax=Oppia nitens TaxID=1686743 RepID=UPI0023D9810A|nr:suppressor of fused homolog [Oppia nitens]